jgi:hypothetical protein
MKKVGLLTFHYPINYGALLQTYATIKAVESEGYNVQVINYYSKDQIGHYDFYKKPQSIKNLFYYIIKTLFLFNYLTKKAKFNNFRKKHFNSTSYYSNAAEINFKKYDVVLTGSDQVFNLSKKDRLPYFQPFTKMHGQIKASYAPSFGISDFDADTLQLMKSYVTDFDYLCCREDLGAKLLSNLTGKAIQNVLDPVFLLNQKEWEKISSPRLVKENYIFIYDLNGKENLIEIAKRIKGDKKIKIVVLSNDPIASIRKAYKDTDKFFNFEGIEDFVSLIKYADYVLTDSFHGTAFSVIFRKPFYSYIALEKASARIYSLLDNLNIHNRIIIKSTIHNFTIEDIAYNEEAINNKIQESKDYLKQIFNH